MNTQASPVGASDWARESTMMPNRGLRRWTGRAFGALSAGLGTVAGVTPHVLHHIGPIAGAAILTGTEGSFVFGAIGFVLTLPLLLRLKRRFQSWVAPGVALALFASMFTISTLWLGPWIRGSFDTSDESAPVDPHHVSISSPRLASLDIVIQAS